MTKDPDTTLLHVKEPTNACESEQPISIKGALFLLTIAFIWLGTGCATVGESEDHINFGLTEQTAFYRDQWVNRNAPEVHIQPQSAAAFAPKVLFMPMRMTQQMQNPTMAAHNVSRTIFQTWNTMQLFPVMEYSSDDNPYRRDTALAMGRQRGADMVVGGFITYLYAGGTVGDTQVAVQIEAIDTTSGQIVWSMAQSGMIPAAKSKDFILFTVKTRVPSDPVHAITKVLAADMGKVIQNWISAPPPATRLEELDNKVKNTIFPEKDPMPAPRRNNLDEQSGYNDSAF